MASFKYTAKDSSGKRIKATIHAPSEQAAMEQLLSSGLILLSLEQGVSDSAAPSSLSLFSRRVPLEQLVIFCRQMYSLTKAGVPILRAMKGLQQSCNHQTLKAALENVHEDLSNGMALSTAMRGHPQAFSHLFISIVQVGENTGRLDDAMLQLAQYYEQEMETRRRIKAAFRYPTFVLITIISAVVFLNIEVIPQFIALFERYGGDLPLPTQVLIATSSFFVNYWWLLLLITMLLVVAYQMWKRTDEGRIKAAHLKLRVPVMGSLVNRALMSRFSRTFSLMLKAGVPLNQALAMAGEALDNAYLEREVAEMKTAIEAGMNLSSVTAKSPIFTALVHQMIMVGEETGQIDELLIEASDFYDREVDYDLKTLSARIEPVLLILVAGMVLLLALGIFLPMWNMLDLARGI